MEPNQTLAWVVTGLSAMAGIAAWLAKLKWSKEFVAAKDAVIQAKEAQIENLRKLTPPELRKIHESTVAMFKEHIARLEQDLATATARINELESLRRNSEDAIDAQKQMYEDMLYYAKKGRDLLEQRLEAEKRHLRENPVGYLLAEDGSYLLREDGGRIALEDSDTTEVENAVGRSP